MQFENWLRPVIFAGCAALLSTAPLLAAAAETPIVRQASSMKFVTIPNVPKCISASVYRGNPMKGPSVIFAKLSPGCVVPWHWHPFNETLMTAGGTIENQVQGGAPYLAHRGDYLFLPAHRPHRAICRGPDRCLTFLVSEGNSNGHWIDAAGREITLKAALQRAMPTRTTNPKR